MRFNFLIFLNILRDVINSFSSVKIFSKEYVKKKIERKFFRSNLTKLIALQMNINTRQKKNI